MLPALFLFSLVILENLAILGIIVVTASMGSFLSSCLFDEHEVERERSADAAKSFFRERSQGEDEDNTGDDDDD